jgi:hypothetical protein
MAQESERAAWPARAWLLTALGAAVGLTIHLLSRNGHFFSDGTAEPWRYALATGLAGGALFFALGIERGAVLKAALFALVCGLVIGAVFLCNGPPSTWNGADGWRLVCAAIAAAVASPFFQALRDEGALRFRYTAVHDHAWGNVVIGFAAWVFVGVVWLLAFLLAALFGLIGIDALRKLLETEWFEFVLTGGALLGAVGLLRDRDRVVAALRRVATAIMAVLAPVLGAGLLIFLLSLPFTGLAPLWSATKATTPILLGCIAAALVLANAAIGDSPEEEAKLPPLRWGALALGFAILPLAVIAAVSTGLRIHQYGLTPARLWALVFVAFAAAYGIAYWVALARRRLGWAEPARLANLNLALGIMAVALILSTPLIGFGVISAHDQEARIASGRTPPEKADWRALAFDFGPAGRRAVERLSRPNVAPAIRKSALAALAAKDRYSFEPVDEKPKKRAELLAHMVILPKPVPVPPDIIDALAAWGGCGTQGGYRCVLLYTPNDTVIPYLSTNCGGDATDDCMRGSGVIRWTGQGWQAGLNYPTESSDPDRARKVREGIASNKIEVRKVDRHQIFIGGVPVGDVFE